MAVPKPRPTGNRPAGRAMDGLADLADLLVVAGARTAHIDRYNNRAISVWVAARTLVQVIDHLLEDADDWLAHDPAQGADEFERLEFANAQGTIFERMKERAGEVASKADALRSLL